MKKPSLTAKILALSCFTLVMTGMIAYQVDHVFPSQSERSLVHVLSTDTDSATLERIKAVEERFSSIERPWTNMDSVTRMQRYRALNINDSLYHNARNKMFMMSSSKVRIHDFSESDSLFWIVRIYESLHPEVKEEKTQSGK